MGGDMSGDISSYGGFGASNSQSVGSSQDVEAVKKKTAMEEYLASTIEQSELVLATMLAAGFPILAPPELVLTDLRQAARISGAGAGVDGDVSISAEGKAYLQFDEEFEQTKHEIINAMWDTFLKNVHETAERYKREELRRYEEELSQHDPKSAAEYYAILMAEATKERDKELVGADELPLVVQFSATLQHWVVVPMKEAAGLAILGGSYPSSSFVAGALASNVDMVRSSIGHVGKELNAQLSISPIADALFAVGPTSGLPADYQAAAALVAALLNSGAVYKATNDTIQAAIAKVEPPKDLQFAINYAKEILSMVSFSLKGEKGSSQERSSQSKMMRLMLLLMAINMVYRAAYGGMGGQELEGLLEGDFDNVDESLIPILSQLIAKINSLLPPRSESGDLIERMKNYVDSKQSIDTMLSTTRIFKGLLVTDDLQQRRLEAGSG